MKTLCHVRGHEYNVLVAIDAVERELGAVRAS
jgi:hypothetical protein